MKNYKVEICFIGNAIVDILSKISNETLNKLKIPKGSMQIVDQETCDKILKHIQNPSIISGGSAANTAVGYNSFGGICCFIGQIGNDKFGEIYLEQIKKYNVLSKVVQGIGPTGTSVVLITPDAERTMNTHLGMCREFNVKDIDEKLLMSSSFLYFTGYMWDTDSQKEAIRGGWRGSLH